LTALIYQVCEYHLSAWLTTRAGIADGHYRKQRCRHRVLETGD
jgi:hypothetical protein